MFKNKGKVIEGYIRAHKPYIVFILAVSVVLGFFRMYSTVYIEYLTDAIERRHAEVLGGMILIACLLQAAFYFLRWVVAVTAARFDEEVACHYRIKLMQHIQKIPFSEYERLSSGNLQTIIRTDSQKASKYMYIVFSRILPNVFILVFSYSYLFSIDAAGSVIMLCISALLYVINRRINRDIEECNVRQRKLAGVINDVVVKVCEVFDSIKAYNCMEYFLGYYHKQRDAYNEALLDSQKIRTQNDMVLSFVSNATLFTAAIILSFKAIAGNSSVGEVIAYITTLSQATICVTTILGWMSSLATAKASIKRIDDILRIEEEVVDEECTNRPESVERICFSNLSYTYDGLKNVIDHLGLELQKGEIYQIIGGSGSGKTTLLKLLMGLYHCRSASGNAEITINGQSVSSIQNLIGYVPANPNLFQATIYDNIAMGADITPEKCLDAAREIGIYDWIVSLPEGIYHMIDKNAGNVSGGQKQAIAILRVLVRNCPIIILDEPFSALDKQREEKLISLLQMLKQDKIIILTSHRDCMPGDEIVSIHM